MKGDRNRSKKSEFYTVRNLMSAVNRNKEFWIMEAGVDVYSDAKGKK